VLGLTLAFAVPAMATELEVTYSSPGGSYSSNGYYNSLFGTAVDISYTITGNESPVTSVQVMVSNQEDEWTSLGSSTSGHYTFTPAYFTEFVPYFLVTFENHAMTLFYADDYLLSWATQQQYNNFSGDTIAPAIRPGDPYYQNTTHTCPKRMCHNGECHLYYLEVLADQPCSLFPSNCDTDDDC